MASYVVTSDSTCDLNTKLIEENGIVLKPLTIILDGKEYRDGVDITVDEVLGFVDGGGALPKTSAVSVEEYVEFFKPFVERGQKVLHFNISSKASSCYQNAVVAAERLGNVWVVDSEHLSTGQGLLVIKACELLKSGKSVPEAFDEITALREKVQTSFVVDRLDFLHKGGRCSLAQLIGSKIFKIHPQISMADGSLKVKKKYSGNLRRSVESYVSDLAAEYQAYDKKLCFVTHCKMQPEIVEMVKVKVAELFDFENVIETEAGVTVSSHCGRNTLGVLFITE